MKQELKGKSRKKSEDARGKSSISSKNQSKSREQSYNDRQNIKSAVNEINIDDI